MGSQSPWEYVVMGHVNLLASRYDKYILAIYVARRLLSNFPTMSRSWKIKKGH